MFDPRVFLGVLVPWYDRGVNLKQFLKPTRGKIALIIVLFFLEVCLHLTVANLRAEIYGGAEINKVVLQILKSVETILLCPALLAIRFIIAPKAFPKDSASLGVYLIPLADTLLLFILVILYWYLLSCLMFFLHKKLQGGLR